MLTQTPTPEEFLALKEQNAQLKQELEQVKKYAADQKAYLDKFYPYSKELAMKVRLLELENSRLKTLLQPKVEHIIPDSNISWTLEGTKLIMNGSGKMPDWVIEGDPERLVPWEDYTDYIQEVVVSDGITTIGDWAFGICQNLVRVSLPDSVEKIGQYAFGVCDSLTEIKLPKGLKEIGEYAFGDCSALCSVQLPEGLQKIDFLAFARCTSLSSIEFPKGLFSIEPYAFSECKALEAVTLPAGLQVLSSEMFKDCTKLKTVRIPTSVTTIEAKAFLNSGLTEITYLGTLEQFRKIKIAGENEELLHAKLTYYAERMVD